MARASMARVWWAAALGAIALGVAACGQGSAQSVSSPPPEQRCGAGALQAAPGRATAAMGHVSRVVQLTNTSARRCYLLGYPDLQRLDASSAPVQTKVVDGGGFSFPNRSPARVELPHGGTASFTADWANATGYSDACPESATLLVTPPHASGRVRVDLPVQACPDGTIHVSPIVAGTAGLGR